LTSLLARPYGQRKYEEAYLPGGAVLVRILIPHSAAIFADAWIIAIQRAELPGSFKIGCRHDQVGPTAGAKAGAHFLAV
jgi:hypothetical protein